MTAIEWAEPPTARNQAIEDFGKVLDTLRENPKRWAKVNESPGFNLSTAAKEGVGPFAPAKSFQVKRVPAPVAGERADIYIRYVGDVPAEDATDGGTVEPLADEAGYADDEPGPEDWEYGEPEPVR